MEVALRGFLRLRDLPSGVLHPCVHVGVGGRPCVVVDLRLERLADQLEDAFGPVPMSRPDLLAFLADQLERVKAVGVPDSTTATAMIDAAYVELQQQQTHG